MTVVIRVERVKRVKRTYNRPPMSFLIPYTLENTESISSADCAVPSARRFNAPFTNA